MNQLLHALRTEPFTCGILGMYLCNVAWQLNHQRWGVAWYWFAAGQITFVATWLMLWKGVR